jgi:hypothetical protein
MKSIMLEFVGQPGLAGASDRADLRFSAMVRNVRRSSVLAPRQPARFGQTEPECQRRDKREPNSSVFRVGGPPKRTRMRCAITLGAQGRPCPLPPVTVI